MAQLPNFQNAYIDIRKLRAYCLNPDHPIGKHKARVFKAKLGLTKSDAVNLKNKILESLSKANANKSFSDEFGERYSVEQKIRIFNQESVITTAWIIRNDENFPRLTTCYLKN